MHFSELYTTFALPELRDVRVRIDFWPQLGDDCGNFAGGAWGGGSGGAEILGISVSSFLGYYRPKGPRTQIIGFLGRKHHRHFCIWAIRPDYLGTLTLRDRASGIFRRGIPGPLKCVGHRMIVFFNYVFTDSVHVVLPVLLGFIGSSVVGFYMPLTCISFGVPAR